LYLDAAVKLMDALKNPKALFKGQYINFTWDRVDSNTQNMKFSVNDGPLLTMSYIILIHKKPMLKNKNYKFKVESC
jgi:uncharacterized protein YjcR